MGLLDLSSFVNGEVAGTRTHEDEVCLLQENHIIKSRKSKRVAASNRVCLSSPTALDFDKHRVLDWIAYHNVHGIDCFLLFLDVEKSNFSDPLTLDVYKKLISSSMVTVINGTLGTMVNGIRVRTVDKSARLGGAVSLSDARSILPKDVAYLGLVDIDEYLVANRLQESSTNRTASYQIPQILEDQVGSQSKMGVYLNRWTYGSSGWMDLPPYEKAPEFTFFTKRGSEPHSRGKFIINFPLARKYKVHFAESHGQHELPLEADEPQMVSTSDAVLSINHYMVASLKECRLKAEGAERDSYSGSDVFEGGYSRPSRARECKPGLYSEVEDSILARWAVPTREKRATLFP